MSSTFDLLFRTDDPTRWGDGIGRNLHPEEADLNFWILLQLYLALEENPTLPKNISSITVADNQMTIHLNDGVTDFGPFDLPVAEFEWRDNWTPDTNYAKWDLFNEANGLYLVRIAHTSNSVFSSDDGNIAGPYYKRLIAYPVTFDIGFFFPGLPGTGIVDGDPIFAYLAAHDFFMVTDLPGSLAAVDAVFTSETVFEIKKNADVIGSITFAAAGINGDFSFLDDIQFVAGDVLKVIKPASVDTTGKNLTVTFAATKGELEGPSSS